jgi:hypothetical protein
MVFRRPVNCGCSASGHLRRVENVDLSRDAEFQTLFAEAMIFPEEG